MRRLDAIVLAAGLGARFGGQKLLAPYRGAPLLAHALRAARQAPVREVVVVTGDDLDAGPAADLSATDAAAPLRLVTADRRREGMSASLRAGLAALAADCEGVFVFLGDMPLIPRETPVALAGALGSALAAAPVFDGQRGHPVLLTAALFDPLMALEGDDGARAVLKSLGARLAIVEVDDPGVLFDVDRPADLAGGARS